MFSRNMTSSSHYTQVGSTSAVEIKKQFESGMTKKDKLKKKLSKLKRKN